MHGIEDGNTHYTCMELQHNIIAIHQDQSTLTLLADMIGWMVIKLLLSVLAAAMTVKNAEVPSAVPSLAAINSSNFKLSSSSRLALVAGELLTKREVVKPEGSGSEVTLNRNSAASPRFLNRREMVWVSPGTTTGYCSALSPK